MRLTVASDSFDELKHLSIMTGNLSMSSTTDLVLRCRGCGYSTIAESETLALYKRNNGMCNWCLPGAKAKKRMRGYVPH